MGKSRYPAKNKPKPKKRDESWITQAFLNDAMTQLIKQGAHRTADTNSILWATDPVECERMNAMGYDCRLMSEYQPERTETHLK